MLRFIPQAAMELTALAVISHYDPVTLGVVVTSAASAFTFITNLASGLRHLPVTVGCSITIIGALTYFSHTRLEDDDKNKNNAPRKGNVFYQIGSGAILFTLALFIAISAHRERYVLGFPATRPPSVTDILADIKNTCRRQYIPSYFYFPFERKYHAFDNVLLIVFFSHARYDINLDYYKEVYSEFFPNIVFIGPGSREDAGFEHSYDVLVDTYESDEDLSDPSFYKMAGRDLFWYHSPFGEYVPNIALGDGDVNANKSHHPPPLNISPDPAIDLTQTWRGWGPDWWWGEPHVGLEVCMRAFRQTPLEMRENLARKTNGTTRLLGGSADTLYIPGRHKDAFMDILGMFLETDCFLEIAVPTAVHLVLPPDEPILYVDHWWIWEGPFNASFVRQKWDEGFEVDSFHTFHWGDRGDDGVWRGNPAHIPDVRSVLLESAQRQGIEFPIRSIQREEAPPDPPDVRMDA
ncbi:hypothetical protein NLI96_g5762 [Meripilus lineatus]|uniref:Uncharacterized protein n=1 Tax=Meripilus lineatus TaxID=2056292 RepID=A0AAD5V763_9APHY|nr:hypothetical protein NLI96_g5762 [Physisporinus lineatus]